MRFTPLIAALLILNGCASTPNDPGRLFTEIQVPPDEAIIYVGKPYSKLQCGPIIRHANQIVLQGKLIAEVACENYAVMRLKPGKYDLEILGSTGWSNQNAPQEMTIEPGKRYFVEIYWHIGATRPGLTFVGSAPVPIKQVTEYSAYRLDVRSKGEQAPSAFLSLYRVNDL